MYILSVKIFLSTDASVTLCTLLLINCFVRDNIYPNKFTNIRKGNEPRADDLCLWENFLRSGVLVCVFMSVFMFYP